LYFDALSLSSTEKKVSKEALETASNSVATECLHSTLYLPKNPKLAYAQTVGFFYGKDKVPLSSVEVSKEPMQ